MISKHPTSSLLIFSLLLLSIFIFILVHVVPLSASRPNCATPINVKNANTADQFRKTTLNVKNEQDEQLLHVHRSKSPLGGKSVQLLNYNVKQLKVNLANFFGFYSFNNLPPSTFNGVLGPTNANIPEVVFTSTKNVKCHACQVVCEKVWTGLGNLSLFTDCEHEFFYYGCDRPCYKTDSDISQMIAICRIRNKCNFNYSVFGLYLKKVTKFIRIMPAIIQDIKSESQSARH